MSFVIALCNGNKEAYLASDTRVTRNDKPVREDFIKIIPKLTFTTTNSVESIQIGFAGIKEIDEIILNKVKEKELCLVKRNAETFAHLIHDEMNEFYNQNNIDKDKFKSMFIVIGKTEKSDDFTFIDKDSIPRYIIYLIVSNNDKISSVLSQKGKITYCFLSSPNITKGQVDNIINSSLFTCQTIKEDLEKIIIKISKIDSTVNDNPFISQIF